MVRVLNPKLIAPKIISEERGILSVFQTPGTLPFIPKRLFIISEVPVGETRGRHAHKECEQFLIATSGEIAVTVSNRNGDFEFFLKSNSEGLLLPKLNWVEFTFLSINTSATILASEVFNESDYISDRGLI